MTALRELAQEREFRVTKSSLLALPGSFVFGLRPWVKRWLEEGATVTETVDWESGDYIYRAIDPDGAK